VEKMHPREKLHIFSKSSVSFSLQKQYKRRKIKNETNWASSNILSTGGTLCTVLYIALMIS